MIPLDEVVHIPDVITGDPTNFGAAIDADSAPTFNVFEEATDTAILANQAMTKRTGHTGTYRGSFTASAANGFEVGKFYNVSVTAVVGGITAKLNVLHFRIVPAESAAGVPKVDQTHYNGLSITTGTVTTDGGNSATSFETDLSQTTDDYWKDALLLLTSGVMAQQIKKVTAYNGTTKIITVSGGFTGTPADGVTFALINR